MFAQLVRAGEGFFRQIFYTVQTPVQRGVGLVQYVKKLKSEVVNLYASNFIWSELKDLFAYTRYKVNIPGKMPLLI